MYLEHSFIALLAFLSVMVSLTRNVFMSLMYSIILFVNACAVLLSLGFEFLALVNVLDISIIGLMDGFEYQLEFALLLNSKDSFKALLGLDRKAIYVWSYDEYRVNRNRLLKDQAGTYGIYSTVSNKLYVGSSVNLASRLQNHLVENWHSNVHLQNALMKYGRESFQVIIFDIVESPLDNLDDIVSILIDLENALLDVLFPTGRLYNILPKAYSKAGYKTPDVVKARISESLMGHIVSDETKARMSDALKGRTLSEATKLKMRDGGLKRTDRYENRMKIIATMGKQVHLQDLLTGEEYYFISLTEAAKFLGLTSGGDVGKVAKRKNNVYLNRWRISFV